MKTDKNRSEKARAPERKTYNIMNSQTSKEKLEWKTKNNLPG